MYHDVKKDDKKMELMLRYSKGARRVPVIVEGARVTIGYQGGT